MRYLSNIWEVSVPYILTVFRCSVVFLRQCLFCLLRQVVLLAEFLFSEVLNGIGQIEEKRCCGGTLDSGVISHESRNHISELKGVLQNERTEFEVPHLSAKEVLCACSS